MAQARLEEEDVSESVYLEEALRCFGSYEEPKEAVKREVVLGKVNHLVQEWMREVGVQQGMMVDVASSLGARVYTFGSYRLGVHGRGADIDTLVVVPNCVDRDRDFFGSLVDLLRQQPEVEQLQPVPDAFVPVIKMVFDGVEMDLLLGKLNMERIPDNLDLGRDEILRGVDEKSRLSLNGSRVVNEILRLVPSIDTFRVALRFVKIWAKGRGVYGNAFGYLGGISWAILVARVCQLYPNATPSVVVKRFFTFVHRWKWYLPVTLREIEDKPEFGLRVWNPNIYVKDSRQLMKIITPAFPCMNSTYNVSNSTLAVMQSEFERGAQMCDAIPEKRVTWFDFARSPAFFQLYKFYVQVEIAAETQESLKKWLGFCESRIRSLIKYLEATENIERVHLWPSSYSVKAPSNDKFPFAAYYYIGYRVKSAAGDKLKKAGGDSSTATTSTTPGTSTSVEGLTQEELGRRAAAMAGVAVVDPSIAASLLVQGGATVTVQLTEAFSAFIEELYKWPGRDSTMDVSLENMARRKIPEHVLHEFEEEVKWDDNVTGTYKKHAERVRAERESIERAMRSVAQTEDNEGKLLDDLETQAKDRLEHMRREATDREQAANQAEVDQGDTNEFVIGIDDDDELGIVPGLEDDGGQFKRRGDLLGGSSKRVHFGAGQAMLDTTMYFLRRSTRKVPRGRIVVHMKER